MGAPPALLLRVGSLDRQVLRPRVRVSVHRDQRRPDRFGDRLRCSRPRSRPRRDRRSRRIASRRAPFCVAGLAHLARDRCRAPRGDPRRPAPLALPPPTPLVSAPDAVRALGESGAKRRLSPRGQAARQARHIPGAGCGPRRAPPRGDPGAWRRLDPRIAPGAGHSSPQPPRGQRVGRLQRRLPPQPSRDAPGARHRRETGDRVGARARRRAGSRPGPGLHHGRLGGRTPHARSPRSPQTTAPSSPASRTPIPRSWRRFPSTASTTSVTSEGVYKRYRDWLFGKVVLKKTFSQDPELYRRGLPDSSRAQRRPALPRLPRRPGHAGAGRGRTELRRSGSRRPRRARSSTSRCRAPSTHSTSSRRFAPPASSRASSASCARWRPHEPRNPPRRHGSARAGRRLPRPRPGSTVPGSSSTEWRRG